MDKRVIAYLTFTKDFDVKSNCGSVVAVNVNESNVTIAMFRNHSLAEILGLRMVIACAERRISRGSSTKDREIKRRLRRLREKERKINILRKTAGFIENLALENNAVVVVGDIDRDAKERMEEKKTNEPRHRIHQWSVLTLIKLLEEKPIHVVRVDERGVRISLGLMFLLKPSSLGFTALRTPLHRDPYHRAPPALGDPSPQLWGNPASWLLSVSMRAPLGSLPGTRIWGIL